MDVCTHKKGGTPNGCRLWGICVRTVRKMRQLKSRWDKVISSFCPRVASGNKADRALAPGTKTTDIFVPPSPQVERLAVALLEGAVNLALDIALGHILALVVELLTAAQTKQQLYATVGIKVELQRHQRIAAVT